MDDSSESQLVGMVEKEVKEIMLKKKTRWKKFVKTAQTVSRQEYLNSITQDLNTFLASSKMISDNIL